MRAFSAQTHQPDPYRAGLELGEALADCAPEVVFLFSSIHYGQDADLAEGLSDALDRPDLLIVGNSGDGIYESGGAIDYGATALGINSEGRAQWFLASAGDVKADPAAATRSAWQQLQQHGPLDWGLLVSDFHTDASQIEKVLADEVQIPVIGGLAADDNRMHDSFVYANRQILRDSLVMLGCRGDLAFDIVIGNTLPAVGNPGKIDDAAGAEVRQIDGLSAMAFIERETGKPVLQSDRGIVSLTVINPDAPSERKLRSIVPDFSTDAGHLGLYGGIESGKSVQVCLATPAQLLHEVDDIAKRVAQAAWQPKAALIVSCGGRKQMLGPQISHEISSLTEAFATGLPLAGFPSFGEIAPLKGPKGFTRNLFHNMTYVVLLLGDK